MYSMWLHDTLLCTGRIDREQIRSSITMIAGRFGHEGLCQLRTELKKLQCEIGYIALVLVREIRAAAIHMNSTTFETWSARVPW